MLLIRKIDCYVQLALALFTIISLPFFYGIGLLVGLFVIGCWQITSALLNAYCFVHAGFQKRIRLYWILCIVNLLLVAAIIHLLGNSDNDSVVEILMIIALPGAIGTGIYYWKIYCKLNEFISLRNELDGLTKSKH